MVHVLSSRPGMYAPIQEVIVSVSDVQLRGALTDAFAEEQKALDANDECFYRYTAGPQDASSRKTFFHSWNKYSYPAAIVAGLSNRLMWCAEQASTLDARLQYFNACASLAHVTNEDLGVGSGKMHTEFYYEFATYLCGDDEWQSDKYWIAESRSFKAWLDHTRLVQPDIGRGILNTLVHELYNHGEFTVCTPLFARWFPDVWGMSEEEATRVLTWCSVHTVGAGEEALHFRHGCNALHQYYAGAGEVLNVDEARDLFREYIRRRSAMMQALTPLGS